MFGFVLTIQQGVDQVHSIARNGAIQLQQAHPMKRASRLQGSQEVASGG